MGRGNEGLKRVTVQMEHGEGNGVKILVAKGLENCEKLIIKKYKAHFPFLRNTIVPPCGPVLQMKN